MKRKSCIQFKLCLASLVLAPLSSAAAESAPAGIPAAVSRPAHNPKLSPDERILKTTFYAGGVQCRRLPCGSLESVLRAPDRGRKKGCSPEAARNASYIWSRVQLEYSIHKAEVSKWMAQYNEVNAEYNRRCGADVPSDDINCQTLRKKLDSLDAGMTAEDKEMFCRAEQLSQIKRFLAWCKDPASNPNIGEFDNYAAAPSPFLEPLLAFLGTELTSVENAVDEERAEVIAAGDEGEESAVCTLEFTSDDDSSDEGSQESTDDDVTETEATTDEPATERDDAIEDLPPVAEESPSPSEVAEDQVSVESPTVEEDVSYFASTTPFYYEGPPAE